MTKYHEFKLKLSPDQQRHLAGGYKIRMKAEQLRGDGEFTVYLTATQVKHLQKMTGSGKGAELQLSKTQLAHHRKVGSGIFSGLIGAIGDAVVGTANKVRDGALDGTNWVGKNGLNLAGKVLKNKSRVVTGALPDVFGLPDAADSLVQYGVDYGTKYSQDKLSDFLTGLKSTKSGGAVIAQFASTMKPAVWRPTLKPVYPDYASEAKSGNTSSHVAAGRAGGALYLPSQRRGTGLYLPAQRRR